MTTFYQFAPSNVKAPSFRPTFDGQQYIVTIIWNVSSQRYYINCSDLAGNLIFFIPIINSDTNIEIFSFEWDAIETRIIATTKIPHTFPVGEIVFVSIVGCTPTTFNGTGNVLILNETQFTFTYPQDPGQYAFGGSVGFLINMTEGYFDSSLVYRDGSFEVTP